MSDRLTLATSTGLPFLSLAFHVATGVAALAAGYVAIAARKGGTWHRRSGVNAPANPPRGEDKYKQHEGDVHTAARHAGEPERRRREVTVSSA